MQTETIDREQLERRHAEAKAANDAAFGDSKALEKECRKLERDIADRQKWLRAFRGEDERLRNQLLDSSEFLSFDPIAAEREALALYLQLRDKRSEWKAATEKLDRARSEENKAFYDLQRCKQKNAVIGALKAELVLGAYLREERAAREAVCQRELVDTGSLPVLTRVDAGSFDPSYCESGVCHRFRAAIAAGYINGREEWIGNAGVKWDRNAPSAN